MQLYIIRHCQSENNALWHRTGSSSGRFADPGLTGIGRQQAALLAHYVAGSSGPGASYQDDPLNHSGIEISHLYCSLMTRSIETALFIAETIDLPLVAREDIHERGGIYLDDPLTGEKNGLAGHNRDHFSDSFPTLTVPDNLGTDGWWNRPYEESETAISRAEKFLEWLISNHDRTDDRVAIITHAGFMQSLFTVLFEIPSVESNLGTGRRIWLNANNGSITRIDFLEDVIRLVYQNRAEFLPAPLTT